MDLPPWDLIAPDPQTGQNSRLCLALLAFHATVFSSVFWSTPLDTREEVAAALPMGDDFLSTPFGKYWHLGRR